MGVKYNHLSPYERGQIAALHRLSVSNREIAQQIGRDRRTVDRELARNSVMSGAESDYDAEHAEQRAAERQSSRSSQRWKCKPKLLRELHVRLSWGHSPDIIAGRCCPEGIEMLSTEGIYQYLYAEARKGSTKYRHLLSTRRSRKRRSRSSDLRGKIPHCISIAERPEAAAARSRIGDWEGDTIVGSAGRSAMLSLVERRSRMTLLQRLADRTAAPTATAIIQRLSSEVFKILTLDNGKEFAGHLRVAEELSGDVYFCDPYSPWQRPSSENSNRISRRSFPQGTDFRKVSDHEVACVEYMLNNRPRKILGYATPWEIYSGRAELPENGVL